VPVDRQLRNGFSDTYVVAYPASVRTASSGLPAKPVEDDQRPVATRFEQRGVRGSESAAVSRKRAISW
jgi:hypothetical protein